MTELTYNRTIMEVYLAAMEAADAALNEIKRDVMERSGIRAGLVITHPAGRAELRYRVRSAHVSVYRGEPAIRLCVRRLYKDGTEAVDNSFLSVTARTKVLDEIAK